MQLFSQAKQSSQPALAVKIKIPLAFPLIKHSEHSVGERCWHGVLLPTTACLLVIFFLHPHSALTVSHAEIVQKSTMSTTWLWIGHKNKTIHEAHASTWRMFSWSLYTAHCYAIRLTCGSGCTCWPECVRVRTRLSHNTLLAWAAWLPVLTPNYCQGFFLIISQGVFVGSSYLWLPLCGSGLKLLCG